MRKFLLSIMGMLTAFGVLADDYAVETTDRLRVWAEFPEVIKADDSSVVYITVYQHDDDDYDYTAFNMEFVLPEGFRMHKVKEGRTEVNDIRLSDRAHPTHSIACNLKDDRYLRIIATSTENADLYKDDAEGNLLDELFTVGIVATESLATGEYPVLMRDIKFCLKNGDARVMAQDPVEYRINVNMPSTGLDEVAAESIDASDCYDLQGIPVDPAKVRGKIVVSKGRKILVK